MAAPININANLNLNPASINASAKQVQQALGRITGQASEFQKSLDASTARVFAFGATTTVINGITQSFRALVTTTINVEAKLKEINSILGAGASEFNKYRNSIFQVAKSTGQSFNTVAEGAAELARQGLSAAESARRLEAALILTRISGLGAEQSVKALTAAMNGFTSAGLTAEQVVNKIVAVDTAFAVSAQDLAEGFSRAGSTAEDAGVSFDELLGLITAVEQRTARGGAVIGNAFKSIFTRLSRGKTIEDLKSLGVAIDANQSGVQKLKALSDALQNISDPTIASQIKELAGGVFQINVVSAALKDIGKDASIFGEATTTSFQAINEATIKNNALNETLKANLNSLVVSATSLGEKIGQLTFAPLLGSLVGIATTLAEGLDKALDPEKGNKFVQGLFKIIGGFISGPGLALFTVAFVKIFRTVLKFAKEGFKTVMEMGSAAERIKNIEGGIVGLLQKDVGLRKTLASTTATQAQKEQAVISAIQRENQLLTQQEQLVRNIARQAASRGVTGFSGAGGFAGKRGKRFASGGEGVMEPNLMTAMMNEAREAPKGASPYLTDFRGKPAVMNTSEMQVRINGREEILREDQIPRFNKGSGKRIQYKGKKGSAEGTSFSEKQAGDRFVMLTPNIDERSSFGKPMTVDKKPYNATHQIHGIKSSQIEKASDKEEDSLEKKVKDSLFKEAADWTSRIKPLDKSAPVSEIAKGFDSIRGAKGALQGAIGSAFEVGISKSLKYEARERDAGGDFDVRGGPNISRIQKLFGIRQTIGDFKNSSSSGNKRSFIRKARREIDAGAFSQKEVKAQAARAAGKNKTNIRVERRKATSAQRASRGPKVPFKAKGTIPNFAVGTALRFLPRLLGMGGKTASKVPKSATGLKPSPFMVPAKPNAQITQQASFGRRVMDKGRDLGRRGVDRVKESGRLEGSIALSMLGTQLSEANAQIEGEAVSVGDTLMTVGTEMASFAATGAAIGGPIGAGVGALVGLTVGLFKSKAAVEAYEKAQAKAAEQDRKSAKIRKARSEGYGDMSQNVVSERLQTMDKMGFGDLGGQVAENINSMSAKLEALKVEQATDERSQEDIDADFEEIFRNFEKETKKAGRIAGKTATIQSKLNNLKRIESDILRFKNNNEGKKLKSAVQKKKDELDDASALMQGVQGPFAGIIKRDLAIGSKQAEAGIAKGELEDLKTQLSIATNPAEKEKLQEQVNKASENFNKKVKDAAIFMAQKQTEIINRQKEVAELSAKLQSEAIATAISGISKGVKGDKINLNNIDDFRKDFKAAKTDEDRAKLIAEFEGTTLAGQSQAMQDALRKAAGLASGDSRQLIDEAGLRKIEAGSRIEGGTAQQRANFAQYLPSRANDGTRADLDAVAAALAKQAKGLEEKMNAFGDAFKKSDVTNQMKKIRSSLEKAANDTKVLASATGVVTGIGEKVNALVTRVDSNLTEQEKRIAKLEAALAEERSEANTIVKNLREGS
jgi:TP901 family phage tail tape measure protein